MELQILIYIFAGLVAIYGITNIASAILTMKESSRLINTINQKTEDFSNIIKPDGVYYKSFIPGHEKKIRELKEDVRYLNKSNRDLRNLYKVNNSSNKEIAMLIKQMRSSQETYWIQLLEKYIKHVYDCEGKTFISKIESNESDVKFTNDEKFSLNSLNIE